MGSHCEVLVVGGPARGTDRGSLACRGLALVTELESRWSRFLPHSDITNINERFAQPSQRDAMEPLAIHWTTRDVLLHAIEGWRLTGGRYDPTLYESLLRLGYDRSFLEMPSSEILRARSTSSTTLPKTPFLDRLTQEAKRVTSARSSPFGCGSVVVDRDASTVWMPSGLGLDLGGIGKGYAADFVAQNLIEWGADGALVNVGGDVRVMGTPPSGDAWIIALEDPRANEAETSGPQTLPNLHITNAAIAVSSTHSRTWSTAKGKVHHILDPRTGLSTSNDLVGAVVVAGAGWWAEVLTKALLVSGPNGALALLQSFDTINSGAHALLFQRGADTIESTGFHAFIATQPNSSKSDQHGTTSDDPCHLKQKDAA
jgi:FAD:protein FMN transferase